MLRPGTKKVRDPIHDYILLDEPALAVINTPRFQRLRRIRQLGTAILVYPGAHHSRFEHGLGAMHLAGLAASSLALPREEALDLRMAALLHDVGHGPFSHLSDDLLREFTGRGHADVGREVVTGVLAEPLARHGADPKRVADLVGGRGRLGALVAGELDVDRMDYLVRDGHYTGVGTGVDLYRIMSELVLLPDGVALHESAVVAAEMLLATRSTMYASVYFHPTCRAAESMLARALRLAIDAGELAASDLPLLDDVDVTARLRASRTDAARVLGDLEERRLLKLAASFRHDEVPDGALLRLAADADAAEAEIARAAGCSPLDVVVDAPDLPTMPEVDARVATADGVVPLRSRSSLVANLPRSRLDHWRLRVFVPEGARAKAGEAARRVLLEP